MQRTLIPLAAAAALFAVPVAANIVTGAAAVVDGDTITMTGTRIRLVGIDAPEAAQICKRGGQPWNCGTDAAQVLGEIIGGQPLECTAVGTDVYGRTLATCTTPVFDVAREMLRRGMAVPAPDAPAEYTEARAIAQQMRYGLWAGEFDLPSAWRAANRGDAPPVARRAVPAARSQRVAAAAPARERRYTNALGCAIKGNNSRHGDLIYHLPGQRYYAQTRPEALFCTEREAAAAGFRRSKE